MIMNQFRPGTEYVIFVTAIRSGVGPFQLPIQ